MKFSIEIQKLGQAISNALSRVIVKLPWFNG